MIGYKGFDKDLKCRGFQYEIGKTYEMDGEIKLCERGFHFCEKISDCFTYYPICFSYYPIRTYARYAKIEALGDVIRGDDGSKCVTNKIRILEEIHMGEAIKMPNSETGNYGTRNSGNPSTQPEIVRCKKCMHSVDYYHDGDCYCSNPKWGLMFFGGSWEFYCADAERRTDAAKNEPNY